MPPRIDPAAVAIDPAARIVALDGEAMGTTWRVLAALPPAADRGAIRTAIVARLAGLVAQMSHWDASSQLARFNRAPAGAWIALPPDFAHVMACALRIAAASGGAFDPAIGALVDLWGFGPPGAMPPPDDAGVSAARARSGVGRLAFDPATSRLRQPGGVALDLSGIAKGHCVDAVADLLAAHGIRHCLVEIGGELAGRGIRPDGDPWWVDCEAPPGVALPGLRIALHQMAVATSGDYRRGAHSLDPRTGRPASGGVAALSVVAATAMEADGWATALTVLGAQAGMALAATHAVAARFVTIADGTAQEHMTPALQAMLA